MVLYYKKKHLINQQTKNLKNNLDRKVNRDDLIYKYFEEQFVKYDNALDLIDRIRKGQIIITNSKIDQEKFRTDLSEIKRGNKKHKSNEQKKPKKNAIYKIDILYKARKEAITFLYDYSSMISEAKNKAKNETSAE